MKKLLLFLILMSQFLLPQLKEMEVKPTENRGGIAIFRDYPDKAGVIFYAQFNDLSFYSSYGIVKVMDDAGGKYIVIIEPVRQTIEVRAPGFKTEMIKLNDLQPRDVLFYEVLPKKNEGLQGISELAITVQATPVDAIVTMDGALFPNNVSTKVTVGKHLLKVEKRGYEKYENEIFVSPDSTLFKVNLPILDPVEVTISSNPEGADIFLDEISQGQTKKTFFLYPGEYELKLTKGDYLPYSKKIIVSKSKAENSFNFDLTRSFGFVQIFVFPEDATIMLNNMVIESGRKHERAPALYRLEVSKDGYISHVANLTVELGKTTFDTITLKARTGALQFTINPTESDCILLKDGKEVARWKGLKLFQDLQIGTYTLMASLPGYKSEDESINIIEGQTAVVEIKMSKENYLPPDLAEKKIVVTGDQNVKLYGMQQNNESELVCSYEFNGIEGEDYEVEFFLRRGDDPGFRHSMDAISGEIGSFEFKKGVKRLTFDLSDSYIMKHPELEYFFEIEVIKSGGGIAWYYYVAGGALLGGTAAVIILTSGNNTEEAPVVIGAPPVRP